MRKLELKDILRHFECNVQRRCCDENGNITFEIWTVQELLSTFGVEHLPLDRLKLILRPMSDLTKSITVKGYNDNKEFIPLVEMCRIVQGTSSSEHLKLIDDRVIDFTVEYHFKQNVFWFQSVNGRKEVYLIPNQNEYFELLNQWHFDCRGLIDMGLAKDYNTIK